MKRRSREERSTARSTFREFIRDHAPPPIRKAFLSARSEYASSKECGRTYVDISMTIPPNSISLACRCTATETMKNYRIRLFFIKVFMAYRFYTRRNCNMVIHLAQQNATYVKAFI